MKKLLLNLKWFDDPDPTLYMVTENNFCSVNGVETQLVRNMMLKTSANGAIIGVDCEGTDLSSLSADIIASLVAQGVLVEIAAEEAGT